jgi:hypothetical protein
MEISGVHWCSFPHSDGQYIAYRLWHIPIYRHKWCGFHYALSTDMDVFTGFYRFPGFFFHWKSREPKLRHWFSYQNAPVNGNFCSPTNCGCCLRVLQVDRRGEDWWWKQHPTWGEIAKKYGIWWIYKLYTWLMLSETSTLQSRNCYFRQLNIRDIYILLLLLLLLCKHACMHAFIHTCIHTCIHT